LSLRKEKPFREREKKGKGRKIKERSPFLRQTSEGSLERAGISDSCEFSYKKKKSPWGKEARGCFVTP
ncbi:MAG: hypothetical protein AB1485_07800, partial [Candidatus Thermoplasmatota archaeon]